MAGKQGDPAPQTTCFSWMGLEQERTLLESYAHKVVEQDARVRAIYHSSVATGLICEAMRNPAAATVPEIAAAGSAVNDLYHLHEKLVMEKHLDCDLVRAVWAPILNPTQEERDLCAKLIGEARRREARLARAVAQGTSRGVKRRRKDDD
jgi:hypothetical protein